MAMSKDEFTKLFTYMQHEFSSINSRLDHTVSKESHDKLMNTVDAYAKQFQDTSQELAMLIHASTRMERWIQQIAGHIGTQLD
jgi:hypothetical protein